MIKLINQKIKFEFPKVKLPLLHGASIEEKQISKEQRKLSQQFQQKIMTERGREDINKSYIREFQANPHQYESSTPLSALKTSQEIKNHKSHRKLKHQRTEKHVKNKVNHEDFLKFLSKKKEEVTVTDPIQ